MNAHVESLSPDAFLSETKSARVLVIDDAEDDILAVKLAFESYKYAYTLETADSADALMSYLDDPTVPRPDLILLDIALSTGMPGLEVLAQLHEKEPDHALNIVVFTASDDPEVKQECLALGASLYITKPFETTAFSHALLPIKQRLNVAA